jgi:hypothetical protein
MPALKDYWELIKPQGEKGKSPALQAYDNVLYAGRAVKMNIISIAQMFTVAACGGNPAARENYGLRILARASKQAWDMLAPEITTRPRKTRKRGRMHMVVDGEAITVQVPFVSIDEAMNYADRSNVLQFPNVTLSQNSGVSHNASDLHKQNVTPECDITEDIILYTLADLGRMDGIPLNAEQLRQYKRRDDNFPPGTGKGSKQLYTINEIIEWWTRRNIKKGETG